MKIGYARVSTTGQSLQVQQEKLSAYSCDKIHEEKLSGKNTDRPELKTVLDFVRSGDELVITKLDRLARSVNDLTKIAEQLREKGCELVVIDQQIDTSTPGGKLMFHMIAAIGEFERELINERTAEGRERAQANGVQFGRKRTLNAQQIKDLQAAMDVPEASASQVATQFGISRSSVYRYCARDV